LFNEEDGDQKSIYNNISQITIMNYTILSR